MNKSSTGEKLTAKRLKIEQDAREKREELG